MKIQRAYKTELNPNNIQRSLLLKHAGTARFVYNWGLQRKEEVYQINQLPLPHIKIPTAIDLHRELNILKKTKFSWMYETSKCAPQEALRDLDKAFKNFFEDRTGYPKFKSKKKGIGSFRLNGSIHVFDNKIQLPRLNMIRLKERCYLPKNVHILSVTLSEKAGKWFVSLNVEEEIDTFKNNGGIVGVDLGIEKLATISDGMTFENPKPFLHYEQKLKRIQREVSRRKKESKNRNKSVRKLQKIHAKIENIRSDTIHKATTWLTKNKSVIVVEDLNILDMTKNHNLAGAIFDAGMGIFLQQLKYKSQWYGSQIVIANQFYPSSKMCSVCGYIKPELLLSERIFECEICHSKIDRDFNASINLRKLAASLSESVNACGEERFMLQDKCSSKKQELNTIGTVIPNGQISRNGE